MASNHRRNPGIPLDMGWVRATRVNLSATQRRAQNLDDAPQRQERLASRLASAGDHND